MRAWIGILGVAAVPGCINRVVDGEDAAADGDTGAIDDESDGGGGSMSGGAVSGVSTSPTTADPSDGGASDGVPPSIDDDGGEESSGDVPELPPTAGLIGAALYEDGLCPWNYDYASEGVPRLTLQISGGSFVCNAILWNALYEAGETPTWFAELAFPVAEPGVYDLAEIGGHMSLNMIEVGGGGGGASGPFESGTLEITRVDADRVEGSLSGIPVGEISNGVDSVSFDVNGTFSAVRCTAAQWLEADPEEPHDPPLPAGCVDP